MDILDNIVQLMQWKKKFFGNKIGHIFGILAREVSDQHVSFKVRLSSLFRMTKGIWK